MTSVATAAPDGTSVEANVRLAYSRLLLTVLLVVPLPLAAVWASSLGVKVEVSYLVLALLVILPLLLLWIVRLKHRTSAHVLADELAWNLMVVAVAAPMLRGLKNAAAHESAVDTWLEAIGESSHELLLAFAASGVLIFLVQFIANFVRLVEDSRAIADRLERTVSPNVELMQRSLLRMETAVQATERSLKDVKQDIEDASRVVGASAQLGIARVLQAVFERYDLPFKDDLDELFGHPQRQLLTLLDDYERRGGESEEVMLLALSSLYHAYVVNENIWVPTDRNDGVLCSFTTSIEQYALSVRSIVIALHSAGLIDKCEFYSTCIGKPVTWLNNSVAGPVPIGMIAFLERFCRFVRSPESKVRWHRLFVHPLQGRASDLWALTPREASDIERGVFNSASVLCVKGEDQRAVVHWGAAEIEGAKRRYAHLFKDFKERDVDDEDMVRVIQNALNHYDAIEALDKECLNSKGFLNMPTYVLCVREPPEPEEQLMWRSFHRVLEDYNRPNSYGLCLWESEGALKEFCDTGQSGVALPRDLFAVRYGGEWLLCLGAEGWSGKGSALKLNMFARRDADPVWLTMSTKLSALFLPSHKGARSWRYLYPGASGVQDHPREIVS